MYTPTPDYYRDYIQHGMQHAEEDTLAHYGVKGMKWRRRKGSTVNGNVSQNPKNTKYKRNSLTNKGYPSSQGDHDMWNLLSNGKVVARGKVYRNSGTSGTKKNRAGSIEYETERWKEGVLAGRERARKKNKKISRAAF